MAEDNPTNSESDKKDPLHDPFDMLSGNTPPSTPSTPPESQTPPPTTGGDPFDMVEKPASTGSSTPPPTPSTPSTPTTGGDPFDMLDKPGTSTPAPTPTTPTTPTPASTSDLPKPSEDPLLKTNPSPTTTPTPSSPSTPTPPPTPATTTPPPSSTPTPQPQTTTTVEKKEEPTRDAYESKVNLDAVIAASNQGNKVPEIQMTNLENLDRKLFMKSERVKASPEERDEAQKKLRYLIKKINKDLEFYRRKEKKSGKGTLVFSVLSSLLAASVTVLLGLNVTTWMRNNNIDWYINTTALVISAFISVIGVVQNFTDSKPLWIKYTDTANQYQQLLDNIEYMELAGEFITIDDVNEIKLAYNRIKSGTNDYIIQVRSQDDGGNTNVLR